MVKGISRRVVVLDAPDQRFFEQAIFIVRNDVFERQGVTTQQVMGEACRIARSYAVAAPPPLWKRIPWWLWMVGAGLLLLLLVL